MRNIILMLVAAFTANFVYAANDISSINASTPTAQESTFNRTDLVIEPYYSLVSTTFWSPCASGQWCQRSTDHKGFMLGLRRERKDYILGFGLSKMTADYIRFFNLSGIDNPSWDSASVELEYIEIPLGIKMLLTGQEQTGVYTRLLVTPMWRYTERATREIGISTSNSMPGSTRITGNDAPIVPNFILNGHAGIGYVWAIIPNFEISFEAAVESELAQIPRWEGNAGMMGVNVLGQAGLAAVF